MADSEAIFFSNPYCPFSIPGNIHGPTQQAIILPANLFAFALCGSKKGHIAFEKKIFFASLLNQTC